MVEALGVERCAFVLGRSVTSLHVARIGVEKKLQKGQGERMVVLFVTLDLRLAMVPNAWAMRYGWEVKTSISCCTREVWSSLRSLRLMAILRNWRC